MYPLDIPAGRTLKQELSILLSKGYTRLLINSGSIFIEEALEKLSTLKWKEDIHVLVDRGIIADDEDTQFRLADSVQTAFFEGHGY